MAAAAEPLKRRLVSLVSTLKAGRTSYDVVYKDIDRYVLPDRCQWSESDANTQNASSYAKIIDTTPVEAVDTCGAGLHSGISSPARPWFELLLADRKAMAAASVKAWLEDCRDAMLDAFRLSNLYNVLPVTYSTCAAFGIDAVIMEEDDNDIFRFESLPIGTYWVSSNSKRRIDCIAREIQMTARQIVERWGYDACSELVRNNYDKPETRETASTVVHVVCPNDQYNPRGITGREKRYVSVYYEQARQSADDRFLGRGGFDTFPVLCPRWETIGQNAYGNGPGKKAVNPSKALQAYERRSAESIARAADPPTQAPSSMAGMRFTPGFRNYYDPSQGTGKAESLYDGRMFNLEGVEMKAAQHRQRIRSLLFVDLFLMISESDRRQITAEEIRAKNEEKILRLGPVLENMNDELLDPLISRAFQSMLARGLLPPPPPEIQGAGLVVRYISVLAQVQKTLGLGALDRFLGALGNMASFDPTVLDNIDKDAVVFEYHDMLGVSHRVIHSEDQREQIRQSRAAAQAQQQQTADLGAQAQAAQVLSQTDTRGQNALTDIIRARTGLAA